MNWQYRAIITPTTLAEPARAACMARLGLTGFAAGAWNSAQDYR